MNFHEAAKKNAIQFEDWMAGAVMRADLLKVLADPLPAGILQLGICYCRKISCLQLVRAKCYWIHRNERQSYSSIREWSNSRMRFSDSC